MLAKLITLGLAIFALVYYVKSNWPGIKDRRMILTFLGCGMLIFLIGVILGQNSFGPTLRLLGTCVFFTGIAIDTTQARKRNK